MIGQAKKKIHTGGVQKIIELTTMALHQSSGPDVHNGVRVLQLNSKRVPATFQTSRDIECNSACVFLFFGLAYHFAISCNTCYTNKPKNVNNLVRGWQIMASDHHGLLVSRWWSLLGNVFNLILGFYYYITVLVLLNQFLDNASNVTQIPCSAFSLCSRSLLHSHTQRYKYTCNIISNRVWFECVFNNGSWKDWKTHSNPPYYWLYYMYTYILSMWDEGGRNEMKNRGGDLGDIWCVAWKLIQQH